MTQEYKQQALDVYLYGKFIGKLSSENSILNFCYDVLYLQKKEAIKLSISMPLQAEIFNHQVTSAFFSSLLPDEAVRKRIARYLRLSPENTFALLKEIGGECAGAVSLYAEGTDVESDSAPTYRVLEEAEAHDILSQLDKRPMLAGEDDIRISGAGAQDKLIIAFVDNKIAIPTGNTPSTHIIKPAIKGLEATVYNEFFCMTLAKRIGLPVPEVEIYWLKDEAYYLIKRYDRRKNSEGKIVRLHQEDFCQALHIPPEQKYEAEGGPTLENCFFLLEQRIKSGLMAGNNKIILFQAVVFNFLIGNGDAHGKNFSLLYDGEAESLTPFYDLLCTLVYTNSFKAKMAMKLSGEYKFRDISLKHFERLGEAIGFKPSFVHKQLLKVLQRVVLESAVLCEELENNTRTTSHIYKEIIEIISTNRKKIGLE